MKALSNLREGKRFNGSSEELAALHKNAEQQVRAHADVPAYRSQLILTRITLATRAVVAFTLDEALAGYREALAENAALIKQFPQVAKYRRLDASVHVQIGVVHFLRGEKLEAEQSIQRSQALFRKLVADYPDEPKLCRAEEDEMATLLVFMLSRDEHDRVIELMGQASAALKKACQAHPRCPQCRRHHAATSVSLGHMYMRLKRDKEAEQAYREGIELWTRVIADFPDTPEYNLFQCQAQSFLLMLHHRQKRWQDAETLAAGMLQAHQKLIEASPRVAYFHAGLATDHIWLATLAKDQHKLDQALEHYRKAIAVCEIAFSMQPGDREHLQMLCASLRSRGDIYQQAGNFAGYQKDLQRSRDLAEWLDSPFVRLTRMRQRLEAGKVELARSDANDLFACGELSGAQWFELAEVFVTFLKAADAAQQASHAEQAVAALRKALDDGFQPSTALENDVQFRPLAGRADFRQLAAARPKRD